MYSIQEVEQRRNRILDEMRAIRSLRRGTINEQFIKDLRKKGAEPVLRGPYYVFSRREGKKTVSRRLKPGEDLDQARLDIAEHKRFLGLCQEFEKLTEQLGDLIRGDEGQEKKRRRSSSKTKS